MSDDVAAAMPFDGPLKNCATLMLWLQETARAGRHLTWLTMLVLPGTHRPLYHRRVSAPRIPLPYT